LHGKSLLSVSFALRQICLNRDTSILYISATAGQAEKRVRLIKQFMDSEKIQNDWCSAPGMLPFEGGNSKFTATEIYIQRHGRSVDPTLQAIGAGGAITGAHVDLVIIDDLEDEKTTNSPGLRQKTREWISATLMPILNQGGLLLVIGTRKHSDDVYNHMKNDPTFTIIEEPAILQWPDKHEYIFEKDKTGKDVLIGVKHEGGKCLWPEFRPMDFLLMERRSMGSTLFEREMQNRVISVEDSIIKEDWIKNCTTNNYTFDHYPPINFNKCSVIQCWDLSIQSDAKKAAANDSDYTVGYTLAKDEKGIIWVLDAIKKRGVTQQDIMNLIIGMYKKHENIGVKSVVVEKNSFGAIHVENLQKTILPIKGVLMTKSNSLKNGIHKIAVLFENGQIRFPTGDTNCNIFLDDFIEEATTYPFAKHDDTITAIFHGINEIGKTFTYHVEMNGRYYNEHGDLEKEDVDELDTFWSDFSESMYEGKYEDKTEKIEYDKNGNPIKYFND
jgi:predicted phage terminase large subunit-like protein